MKRRAIATVSTALLLTSCGGGAAHAEGDSLLLQRVPSHVTVTTRPVTGLGRILVDGAGFALYMFPPDAGGRVSCTGPCAGTWPPLAIAAGHLPAAAGINAADLGTLHDPNTGARVVTYLGYPLYRYAGDLTPGVANGQALFNNGGPWYVLDPAGQPVTTDPEQPR